MVAAFGQGPAALSLTRRFARVLWNERLLNGREHDRVGGQTDLRVAPSTHGATGTVACLPSSGQSALQSVTGKV